MTPLDPVARVVSSLLRRRLPPQIADDVVGDLIEHYRRRRTLRHAWLVAEAVKLSFRLRGSFLAPAQLPARRASATILIDIWARDVRYALRSLFRSRGFAAVALASLALGIGLATAVFSVLDGVLLRPLPYGDADSIITIREIVAGRQTPSDAVPRQTLRRWELQPRTIAAFGPYAVSDTRISADTQNYVGVRVETGDRFFDVLKTIPEHGRLLGPADADRAAPMVALLTHTFWKTAFNGDAHVIGRSILLDDRPAAIVGVLPADFNYPSPTVAVFTPGRWKLPDVQPGMGQAFVGPTLQVLARMRPGVTPAEVERDVVQITQQIAASYNRTIPTPVFAVTRLQDDLVKGVKPALVVLLAAVVCVLVIVCVNLTNLLLARGTARQREIGVRAALGASRWGMMRPLMLEGLLLSLIGGALGLAVATLLIASVPLTSSIDPMLASQVHIDARVLGFTVVMSAAIGIAVGILPAWQIPHRQGPGLAASHVQLLPGASVRAERVRSGLVIAQVALAMGLAMAAALLSRSLVTLLDVDLGFQPEQAVSFRVRLPPGGGTAFDWRARFYEQLVARLGGQPGVRAAGFTTSLPTYETFSQSPISIEGLTLDAAAPRRVHREIVTPRYFDALGMTLSSGRQIAETDTATSERVIVVNDAFVAAVLPDRDPFAHRVTTFGDFARIVGVVRSKRHAGLRSERRPEIYLPLSQAPPDIVTQSGAGVVFRASSPMLLMPVVRTAVRELQPQAAIEDEGAIEDRIWDSTAQPRFYATVMSVFATLALVTALVGLFGVLSFIVERRRVEIGVRRALGATSQDISRLVVGRGLKLLAIAVPLGLVCSAAGVGLLQSLLFGVKPMDVPTFVAIGIAVPAVALVACVWPARKAINIAPLDALREE